MCVDWNDGMSGGLMRWQMLNAAGEECDVVKIAL